MVYLNEEQLDEIEEVTLSKVLCTVMLDEMVNTLPFAFYKEEATTWQGYKNLPKSCKEIGKLNLDAWKNTGRKTNKTEIFFNFCGQNGRLFFQGAFRTYFLEYNSI